MYVTEEKRASDKRRHEKRVTLHCDVFTDNMLSRSSALLILLLQVICSDAKRSCLSKCYVGGSIGKPLVIPDGACTTAVVDDCKVDINFQYNRGTYTVSFGMSYISSYSRFIYVLPSNYLSYSETYSCSKHDSCALDFAKNRVLELGNRTYDSWKLTRELAPILEEARPAGAGLSCHDNDECAGGVCLIDYDTKANSQKKRGCEKQDSITRVSVYDSGNYASFEVQCNRTKCNSPETLNQVKAIFASYNLTDANGRISSANAIVTSTSLVFGLATFFYALFI